MEQTLKEQLASEVDGAIAGYHKILTVFNCIHLDLLNADSAEEVEESMQFLHAQKELISLGQYRFLLGKLERLRDHFLDKELD